MNTHTVFFNHQPAPSLYFMLLLATAAPEPFMPLLMLLLKITLWKALVIIKAVIELYVAI